MQGGFLFYGEHLHWYRIRGQLVVLDEDLAKCFGVKTRVLNQYARRTFFVEHVTHFKLEFAEMHRIYVVEGHRGNEKRNRRYPYKVYTKRAVFLFAGHYGRIRT